MFSTIYCDMDSVLVDFPSGVSAITGKPFQPFWDHQPTIDKIGAIDKFWADLPWMPDGKQLWKVIKPLDPHILSAWPRWGKDAAIVGKHEWIKKNLGSIPTSRINLVARSDKQKFAYDTKLKKPNILIDDYEDNIKEWRQARGIGILHTDTNSTVSKLREFGII